VSTTARTSSPAARAASTVSSVCEIVPSPGARGDHDRQPERDREVAHREAQRERDEQPADALDEDRVGAPPRRAAAAIVAAGSTVVPGELGRQVR
jgi:hypothetical protein